MHIRYSCTKCTCQHYMYLCVHSVHMHILFTHMYMCIFCTCVHNGYMMCMCTHRDTTINVNVHDVCNMYIYIMYYLCIAILYAVVIIWYHCNITINVPIAHISYIPIVYTLCTCNCTYCTDYVRFWYICIVYTYVHNTLCTYGMYSAHWL